MKVQFKINFVGGESVTVSTSPVDMIRTEAYTGKSLASGDPSFTDLCYMLYSATKRAGKAGSDFEAWVEMVDSFDEVSDADPNVSEEPESK